MLQRYDLLCGYANLYGTINFTLYRFKSDGSLDTDFDTDGIVTGPEGKCSDMGIQSTGRPILAGYKTKGNRELLVTAYRPDGQRDTTFGGSGSGYSPIKINGMTLLPNDDIVLTGHHSIITPFSFFTTILNKDGAPTLRFANGAFFQSNFNGKDEEMHNVAFGPGGEIVITGYYENNVTGEDQVVLSMKNEMPPQQVRLITGKGEGAQGDTILVPVRLEGCTDLYFMQGEIALANPSVGTIVGMVKKTTDVTFSGSAFNFFNGNGVKLPNDTLFFVKIVLSGAPGDSTAVKVTAPAGSVIEVGCSTVNLTPHTVVAGSVRILANLKLSGTLLDRLGKPVGKAFVSLTGTTKDNKPLSYQMTTGADGTYLFDKVPPGSSVTIKPSKDINPKNGVTAHDIFVGQRWLLNLKPPEFTSALQVVAGDANNNKLFSSQDLAIMQSVSLGMIMSFPNQTSWVFVPASHTFPTAFTVSNVFPCPDQAKLTNVQKDAAIHFTGIKVGDIVTTADAQNKSGSGTGHDPSPLEFRLHQERTGDEITVRIEAQRFQDIGSVQWGLHFDAAQMQWVRADAPGWSVNAAGAAAGELAFSWFSRDGLAKTIYNGNPVITLHFQAAHANALHMNTPLVDLSQAIVETEAIALPAGAQTTQSVPLLLHGPAATTPVSNLALADGYHLGQSTPNPARGIANIPFGLGRDGKVLLEVLDNTGRVVRHVTTTLPAGVHQIEISVEDLLPGSYFYRLQSGGFSSVRSLIVIP